MGKYDILEMYRCDFCKGESCPTGVLEFSGGVSRHTDKHHLAEVTSAFRGF